MYFVRYKKNSKNFQNVLRGLLNSTLPDINANATRRGYRIETTGSVSTLLNPEIRNLLGKEYDHESVKGYKIWFVDTVDKVKKNY